MPQPSRSPTTLERTIGVGEPLHRGSLHDYHSLVPAPGEPHRRRQELDGRRTAAAGRRSLLSLAHLTDLQLADVQSPGRLEYLQPLARDPRTAPLLPMFRPQELLGAHAAELLVRALNGVRTSPVTGAPLQLALTTGDNIDNLQSNELRTFLALLSGGVVRPDSGGPAYEGVQDGRAPWAWSPGAARDEYGESFGFPRVPGLLDAGRRSFRATGLGLPWLTCYGNHDGLVQGRTPLTPVLAAVLTGDQKVRALAGAELPDVLDQAVRFFEGPAWQVTPDPERRPITRQEYVAAHFTDGGTPAGHGFTDENRERGTAYYAYDGVPGVRLIVLDSTNPGGQAEGSIGAGQLRWLEGRLREVHTRYPDDDGRRIGGGGEDRLVVVASHHGLGTLTNPVSRPDPGAGPSDLPRVLGPAVERLLHRFPNVLCWISGHIHRHMVRPRPGAAGGFWEVTTASVMEWPCQARLIEVVDNADGTLSIVCTAVDHTAPLRPGRLDTTAGLAAWHRELAANDPGRVAGLGAVGGPSDRNVELVIADPRRRPS